VQGLNNEEIDAAFIRSPVADVVGLTVRPLLQEKMVVALPKGHPLASSGRKKKSAQSRSAPLPLAELANETFILYKRPGGPGLYDTIITACRGSGFSPHVGQEAPRIISTLNLVAAASGVSLVARITASIADGRRRLSPARRQRAAHCASDPRLSPRREFGVGAALH
jgi:DNA-binding transcriptional LysR family regulator